MVPFARWRPDSANLNSQFASDVMNVLPAADSYIPAPKLVPYSLAAPAQPLGGFTARDSNGQVVIFLGTANRLYTLNATTLDWTDVSKRGAEMIVNGGMDADTDWSKGTGVTIASGVASLAAVPTSSVALSQSVSFAEGTEYEVVQTTSNYVSGSIFVRFGGGTAVSGAVRTANGTYTEYLTAASGNNSFAIRTGTLPTLDIDNISVKAITDYNATVDERWRFTQFGDFVIAVNVNDDPQVFELGVSTHFEDLAGSPPRARHVAVWGDFLALLGLSGNENRIHWSGLNDIEEWTPGTDNSDFQDFPDGGDVQGATSATNPIVFLKSAIQFGTFMPGSIEVFTFHKVHEKRGAVAPYAIASRGAFTFFIDNGAFFQIFTDGSIKEIGLEKVNRTVFDNISGSDLFGIIGEVDPNYNRVYFSVKYESTTDAFDRIILYDWGIGEWSQIETATNILFPLTSGTVGYTLEGLDEVSASLDELPFSLDSKVWQGGAPVMAAFDADYKLGFFSGDNAEATLTTQEMGDTTGMVTRVSEIVPIVDTDAALVSIGARMRRGDDFVWSGEVAQSTNTGIVRKISRARYHKFKVRIPESTSWTHAQGVDVKSASAGMR